MIKSKAEAHARNLALRQRAEKLLARRAQYGAEADSRELTEILSELQTYQLELELQNEELLATELQLQRVRDKYLDLYENAPAAYFTLNEKSKILESNHAGAALLGIELDSLIGAHLSSFCTKDNSDTLHLHLFKVVETERAETCELHLKTSNGEVLDACLQTRLVIPRCRQLRVIILDLTARKYLEKLQVKLQRMEAIGHLAAGLAHEIYTPIQYLKNNTVFIKQNATTLFALVTDLQVAAENFAETEGSHDLMTKFNILIENSDLEYLREEIPMALDQSIEGLNEITKIVHSIKAFVRQDTGRIVSCDLNASIENAATVSRNEWKDIAELSLNLDASPSLVHCNPAEINQAILNLIVNAVDAIRGKMIGGESKKGKISISTSRQKDYFEIRVQDTGRGIPREVQTKVFDMFFTTKDVGRGTGQGLAIAYSTIVNRHQGSLSMKSEEGLGTTFIARLPYAGPRSE